MFGKALAARRVAMRAYRGHHGRHEGRYRLLDAFAEEFLIGSWMPASPRSMRWAWPAAWRRAAKPVVALYSTFFQRAIDQVIINNALPDLDVVFAIDRAGIVGEDARRTMACSTSPTCA